MRLALAVALLATAGAGCRAARMPVDPRLAAAADAYEVTGANPRTWSAPLAFGPWRTGRVGGEATLGWSVAALGAEVAGSTRPYAWRIEGAGVTVEAECHERRLEAVVRGVTFDARAAAGKPVLACAFRTPGAAAAWTLAVRAEPGAAVRFAGDLRDPGGASTHAVRSLHALEGSSLPLDVPSGWTLERGGGPAAAVETLGAGRVFLPRGAPEAPVLAAASAALLLFHPDPEQR
jgi:hypothetical protein